MTATSDKEFEWRKARGEKGVVKLNIDYIGVWDTVKALGLPEKLHISDLANAAHHFHDADLSSSVMSARHAIAIDEYRWTYPALPWDNMDDLNARRRGAYLQQYFPGNHGSVGGGGSRAGLSGIALHWIAIGAVEAGLEVNWDEFDHNAPDLNFRDKLVNKFATKPPTSRELRNATSGRVAPKCETELSLAALDRYVDDAGYRPPGLRGLKDELFGMSADEIDHLRTLMIERDGGQTHLRDDRRRPRQDITRRWIKVDEEDAVG